jgi:hypothetical protein
MVISFSIFISHFPQINLLNVNPSSARYRMEIRCNGRHFNAFAHA